MTTAPSPVGAILTVAKTDPRQPTAALALDEPTADALADALSALIGWGWHDRDRCALILERVNAARAFLKTA